MFFNNILRLDKYTPSLLSFNNTKKSSNDLNIGSVFSILVWYLVKGRTLIFFQLHSRNFLSQLFSWSCHQVGITDTLLKTEKLKFLKANNFCDEKKNLETDKTELEPRSLKYFSFPYGKIVVKRLFFKRL